MFTTVALLQRKAGDVPSSGVHSLQTLRGKGCSFTTLCSRYQDSIVCFGFVNGCHQGFMSFVLLLSEHTLETCPSPGARSDGFIISSCSFIPQSNTVLPALPKLPITSPQLKHPLLKGLHPGFADIKSWWPFCSKGCSPCTVMVRRFLLCICQVSALLSSTEEPFKILSFPYVCL